MGWPPLFLPSRPICQCVKRPRKSYRERTRGDKLLTLCLLSSGVTRVPEWSIYGGKGHQGLLILTGISDSGSPLRYTNVCYLVLVLCKRCLLVCLTDTVHNQQLIFSVNILRWGEVGVAIDTLGRQRFTCRVLPGRSPIYIVIQAVWMLASPHMHIITWWYTVVYSAHTHARTHAFTLISGFPLTLPPAALRSLHLADIHPPAIIPILWLRIF